jgi:glycosyltransferase involved in cell wall biosynthesis
MKITIITPTIGRLSLVDTIKSVLEQDYTEIEHLVVPDTNKYKDYGHSVRRDAVSNATGEYITYMDDDDKYIGTSAISEMARGIQSFNYPTFLFYPAKRFEQIFFSDAGHGGLVVSNQYIHKRVDKEGNLITFTPGGYGHDNKWIKEMTKKYDYVMYNCNPLVSVDVIGEGK